MHVDGRTCLGEEVIFRRPVDLWSLILSQVARLPLDQHKLSKTHTVAAKENSNAHVWVSLLCLILLRSGPWGGGKPSADAAGNSDRSDKHVYFNGLFIQTN